MIILHSLIQCPVPDCVQSKIVSSFYAEFRTVNNCWFPINTVPEWSPILIRLIIIPDSVSIFALGIFRSPTHFPGCLFPQGVTLSSQVQLTSGHHNWPSATDRNSFPGGELYCWAICSYLPGRHWEHPTQQLFPHSSPACWLTPTQSGLSLISLKFPSKVDH